MSIIDELKVFKKHNEKKLDINDFYSIMVDAGNLPSPIGIGGTSSRFYLSDSKIDKIYEIDLNNFKTLGANEVPPSYYDGTIVGVKVDNIKS